MPDRSEGANLRGSRGSLPAVSREHQCERDRPPRMRGLRARVLSTLGPDILLVILLLVLDVEARRGAKEARRMTIWNCVSDMLVLCADVEPGDGRMEHCLRGKHSVLTSMCSGMRNSPDRMPKLCEADVRLLCPDEEIGAHQLTCLRRQRNQLSEECWGQLSRLQSDGWEMLPDRFKMLSVDNHCSASILQVCEGVAPGYGALKDCVNNNWNKLERDCGLKPREKPEVVFPTCENDALRLCKHIAPGNSRVKTCLNGFDGHWSEDGTTLSKPCQAALILDAAGISTICAEDYVRFCVHLERSKEELITCLERHESKLAMGCTVRHHKHQDVHGATNLVTGQTATACQPDIRKFCKGIKAGKGLIHECLMKHRHMLSPECQVPRGQVVRYGSDSPRNQRRSSDSQSPPDYVLSEKDVARQEAELKYDIEEGAFKNADLDGSGDLDEREIGFAIQKIRGDLVDRSMAKEMILGADKDSSGTVSIEEFHEYFGTTLPESGEQGEQASGESTEDGHRTFRSRQEGNLARLLLSPYVTTPVLIVVAFLIYVYRSNVRRSDKPRRRNMNLAASDTSHRNGPSVRRRTYR